MHDLPSAAERVDVRLFAIERTLSTLRGNTTIPRQTIRRELREMERDLRSLPVIERRQRGTVERLLASIHPDAV